MRRSVRLLGLVAALSAIWGLCHRPAAVATATGKVAVEGSLSSSDLTPAVGDMLYLYFNVTPLEDLPALTLRLKLPAGLERVGDGAAERVYDDPSADETKTLVLAVRVAEPGSHTVVGEAVIVESEDFVESRAFALVLDCQLQAAE